MQKKAFMDLSFLSPFLESDVEIDKITLIKRCTGKINQALLSLIKIIIFYRVGKDEQGNIYLV